MAWNLWRLHYCSLLIKYQRLIKKIKYDALIEKFSNTYQLCNKDLNKFDLLLRKGIYLYEYIDSWKRSEEPVPLVEDHYYSELNKEGIRNEDLKHAEKVCNTFKIKDLGEHHDSYVQSDTILLADVFENFRDKNLILLTFYLLQDLHGKHV